MESRPEARDSGPAGSPVARPRRRGIAGNPVAALGFGLGLLALAGGLLAYALFPRPAQLRFAAVASATSGELAGDLIPYLELALTDQGVDRRWVDVASPNQALEQVDSGTIDIAIVEAVLDQSGLDRVNVRQLAPLEEMPMQLLLRRDLYDQAVASGSLKTTLTGKNISLGQRDSGREELGSALIAALGVTDFTTVYLTDPALQALAPDRPQAVPDAVVTMGVLPSKVVTHLVSSFGYRLYPLPVLQNYQLRGTLAGRKKAQYALNESVIPARLYSVDPPEPPTDLPTFSSHLLLVANKDVPNAAVIATLRAVYQSGFVPAYGERFTPERLSGMQPLFPLHPGVTEFLRAEPKTLQDSLAQAARFLPALSALVPAWLFLRGWWRRWRNRDRVVSLRAYMEELTGLERRAREIDRGPRRSVEDVLALRLRLGELKSDALEAFARGLVTDEYLLNTFLSSVADLRTYLVTVPATDAVARVVAPDASI